jgi:nicotinamide phosphoribosyltransferase
MQWAMKCSAIGVRVHTGLRQDGLLGKLEWRDVYKDPITDSGKRSKRGRVVLWESGGEYESAVECPTRWTDKGFGWNPVMKEVFCDGELKNEITFAEVRANARK